MWKISTLCAIVATLILIEAAPTPDTLENVDDLKLNCDKVCTSAGAEARFDTESFNCKCVLVHKTDDAELALMKKNAELLKLSLEPIEEASKCRQRRHISAHNYNRLLPHAEQGMAPIVGQGHLLPPKPLLPANRPLLPMSRGKWNPATRNAAAHAEQVRQRLRELSQRYANSEHRARFAADRAKFRAREKQRMQRFNSRLSPGLLPRRGVVGAAAANDNLTTPPPQETKRKGHKNSSRGGDEAHNDQLNPHNGIITQPKEYMDD